MGGKYVGAIVRRREDSRLLTGRGRYVDDLRVPGCLHAALLRSPHAHARIRMIRLDRARAHPAVVACFTYEDLTPALQPLPVAGAPPPLLQARVGFRLKTAAQPALAHDRVRYVGEPVAVVVATGPYAAEDALDLVDVEYEPLPAVVDVEGGLAPGAALLHEDWGDNVGVAFEARIGDPGRALAEAPVRVAARIRVPRYAGMPLEPRGILAEPAARGEGLTVWASTQVPHWLQRTLGETLGLPAHKLRVVAPEVGGGFGTKASIYPEDVLIPLIAARLGRPVKTPCSSTDRSTAGSPRGSAGASGRRSSTTRRGSSSPAPSWTTPCRAPTSCRSSRRSTWSTPRRATLSRSRGWGKGAPSPRRPPSPTRSRTRSPPSGPGSRKAP